MAQVDTQRDSDELSPRAQRERRHMYSMLHMWDDEDTKVAAPLPMAELVAEDEFSHT